MERERDKKIKEISKLKKKRKKIIKNGSDEKKLKNINDKLIKTMCDLIKKIIEMHTFKLKFIQNPKFFYRSRRLFVTFKNFQIAREFKDLYNKQYRDNKTLFLTSGASRRMTEKQNNLVKKGGSPKSGRSSMSGKLQRNEEKYVDVDNKIKYRGSTMDAKLKNSFQELVEKQKKFDNEEDISKSSTSNKQFYSEQPKSYDNKLKKELKRGILSKMMEFYTRKSNSEELLLSLINI